MAAPTKRWGSYLSQAMAGVEARLDNILTENEELANDPKKSSSSLPPTPAPASASPRKSSPGISLAAFSFLHRHPDRFPSLQGPRELLRPAVATIDSRSVLRGHWPPRQLPRSSTTRLRNPPGPPKPALAKAPTSPAVFPPTAPTARASSCKIRSPREVRKKNLAHLAAPRPRPWK